MKLAVTSADTRTVTGHAGRCQRFWVYEVDGREVRGRALLEVPLEETFHAHHHAPPAGLAGIAALISGGMGQGLAARLKALGVEAVVTSETDPDRAVSGFLDGTLPRLEPHAAHGHQPH